MSATTSPTPQAVSLQIYGAPGGTPGSETFQVIVQNYQGVAPTATQSNPSPASGSGGVTTVTIDATPASTAIDPTTGTTTATFNGKIVADGAGTDTWTIAAQNNVLAVLNNTVTAIYETGSVTLGPVTAPTYAAPAAPSA